MGFKETADPSKRQLLAEGLDVCAVLLRLLDAHGIADVQVHDFGGNDKEQLLRYLNVLKTQRSFQSSVTHLGIIRDAERQPAASAISSVNATLLKAGISAGQFGALVQVSAFILPDNSSSGCLETLLYDTRLNPRIDGCVDMFIACAWPTGGPSMSGMPNEHKMRVQCYLAALAPEKRSGQALAAGLFDPRHDAFSGLTSFLRTF